MTETSRLVRRARIGAAFSASVESDPAGGWLTVVSFGDGATLTKWFVREAEALRYLEDLAEWLGAARNGASNRH